MVSYISTGRKGYDELIKGFPKQEITVIQENTMENMLTMWTPLIANTHQSVVYSEYRPPMPIQRHVDEDVKVVESYDNLDEDIFSEDIDLIVAETNELPDLTNWLTLAKEYDVAIVIIAENPTPSLLATASIILTIQTNADSTQIDYRLVLTKHAFEEIDSDAKISKLVFDPLPVIKPSNTYG